MMFVTAIVCHTPLRKAVLDAIDIVVVITAHVVHLIEGLTIGTAWGREFGVYTTATIAAIICRR